MADTDLARATIGRIEIKEARDFLRRNTRYKRLVNREYEREIRGYGDQVEVPTFGEIEWRTYARGQTLSRDALAAAWQNMTIDIAWYMNVGNDDIDHKQQMPKARDSFVDRAMYALGQNCDRQISQMYVDVANGNTIGSDASPFGVTQANAYDMVTALLGKLMKSDVSEEQLGMIGCVGPAFLLRYLHMDPRNIGSATYGGNTEAGMEQMRRARAMLDSNAGGMDVMWSNNAPKVGNNWKVIAAHLDAHTWAEQLMKFEWHNPSETFVGGYKGLFVAGQQTFEPKAMAVATINDGGSGALVI